jgi:chromosome segregation ATPase
MDTSARRAQLISTTLAGQARAGQDVAGLERAIADLRGRADDADVRALRADLEAQRDATARLEDRLERFEVGMRRICASLGLLRTRLVEMSASEEEAAQRELARELRERTDLLAQAMAEVFAADDDQQVELPVAEHRPDG